MKGKKWIVKVLAGVMTLSMLSTAAVYAEDLAGEDIGDIVEINMYGLGFFGDGGLTEVMDAINEISEKEIGVHVNYTLLDVQTYMSQMSLMVAGGESVDLMLAAGMPAISFQTQSAQNQLMDITDLLAEYAPELNEMMADYLPATTVNGTVYGVPCYRVYNSAFYIMMRKDILDYLGLTEEAEAIDSWSDYKAVLEKVHDAQDELPEELQTNAMICNGDTAGGVISGRGFNSGADDFADNYGFDALGDNNRVICVEDGVVSNYYENENYKAMIERVEDWYNDGLVYKDAATEQNGTDQMIAAGTSFSGLTLSEIGVETAKSASIGYDMVIVKIIDTPIVSANGFDWAYVVPVTSEQPEAAVEFMQLMYTNPEIENLFVYGIEGRDYEVVDGEACYLPTKEYQNSDFFFGNQFNAYPAQGSGADFRERALEEMQNAEISPYYGCVVNTEPIANELTAISQVYEQYKPGLESGTSDISELDAMNEALYGAGLQKVLDHYQACLDEWLAANAE